MNKQYTKEEYEALVPRIIDHMGKSSQWGEFFPMSLSPFAYNETVAQEYFPLTQQEAIKQKLQWKEADLINRYEGKKVELPFNINDVSDELIRQILTCSECGKNYKIIPQELELYRKLQVSPPQKCFDCRYKARRELRNPRKLWSRQCSKCNMEIQTTYSPDRPEIIYCEACYLKEVY